MAFQNDYFTAHRMHPVLICKTLEIHSTKHVSYLRMGNDAVAKALGLKHRGDNVFQIQFGRDIESVMQGVEAALAEYDRAVNNGAA